MYAATTFILMEAADIMFPRLGLPDWTVTFLIVLLIAGFPVTLILSWIFDVTPQGIQKTDSIETAAELSQAPDKRKRGLKAGDLIIAVLLVIVCILLYPRLFHTDRLMTIRDDEGRISISVMPFLNLTGDSTFNVWQGGIQNLLISALSNSPELEVRQYLTMSDIISQKRNVNQATVSPALAHEVAADLETRTFINGKILKAGDKIRISTQLVNTETEEIYKTFLAEGSREDDVFVLIDSLGGLIRNYLEIKKLAGEYNSPEITDQVFTNSAEAFQYYIHGLEAFEKLDLGSSIQWLKQAIETDTNFIDAYIFISFAYMASAQFQLSKDWCIKANSLRDDLPVRGQLVLDHLFAYHFETPVKEISVCKQILELDKMNTLYWFLLGDAYFKLEQYKTAVFYWEKTLEMHRRMGTRFRIPYLYSSLGEALHKLGDHQRENEIYQLELSMLPDNGGIIRAQAICALSQQQTVKANEYLNRYRDVRKARGSGESQILGSIANIYWNAGLIKEAEQRFRRSLEIDQGNAMILNNFAWLLIEQEMNVKEGMELVNRALSIEPDNIYALDTRGWGYYLQGNYEEALKDLEKAWELRALYSQVIFRHLQTVKQALAGKPSLQVSGSDNH